METILWSRGTLEPGRNPFSAMIRFDPADIDTFKDTRGQFNRQCAIVMDTGNAIWTSCSGLKFVRLIHQLQYFLTFTIINRDNSFGVRNNQPMINQILATLLELLEVCNERNVKDHIAAKGQSTRSGLECAVVSTTSCIYCISDGCVDKLLGACNTTRLFQGG